MGCWRRCGRLLTRIRRSGRRRSVSVERSSAARPTSERRHNCSVFRWSAIAPQRWQTRPIVGLPSTPRRSESSTSCGGRWRRRLDKWRPCSARGRRRSGALLTFMSLTLKCRALGCGSTLRMCSATRVTALGTYSSWPQTLTLRLASTAPKGLTMCIGGGSWR